MSAVVRPAKGAMARDLGVSLPGFRPRAPWYGPDLQTLRNVLRGPVTTPPPGVRTERLTLPLDDGSGDVLSARLDRPPASWERGGPVVVLIHGLGGDERSAYLEASAGRLLRCGRTVVRLNLRGAGPSRATCRAQYHAGRTEDLLAAISALPADLVSEELVLVGFSLGGNMLLKFLAEFGDRAPVRAAMSVSAPIDLAAASRRILERRNTVYHRHLLTGMRAEALAAEGLSDDERRILGEVRSIVEFDDRIVAPRNGFAGAEDYYARCHARRFLPEIRVPTLVLHALDDPWIPAEAYTSFDWSSAPALVAGLPPGGGHVGFHAQGGRVPWHDRCLEALLARF